jgi:hypothetical protein
MKNALFCGTLWEPPPGKTIRLKSFSADQYYEIDLDNKTCTCEKFITTHELCKHLNVLGVYGRRRPFVARSHPTFSQALSGMVKSIRLRRSEDAIYWLVYLETFKEPEHRFRTARRILIGAAEDGQSITVMERVVDSFRRISKPKADIEELATEVLRICKVPNWWNPSTGGRDYIYSGMLGHRKLAYLKSTITAESLPRLIEQEIRKKAKPTALAGIMGLSEIRMGGSRQAELVSDLAQRNGLEYAERLAQVHLRARSALSSDNNFLCQAVWILAGGDSPVADVIPEVTTAEVSKLIEEARERWKDPQPIPQWCCDGVHSAGNDVRFMGTWEHMNAVCRAFSHYGRVDPNDKWLPEFQSFDGLIVQTAEEENCNQLHEPTENR